MNRLASPKKGKVMKDFTILVVDDEKIQRESLVGFLKKKKYRTLAADSGERALELIDRHAVDLVLSDVKMTGISGYQLLREIKSRNPDIAVVMMTAFGEIADAVQAMKDGAFDYLTKPIDLDELEVIIERAERLNHLISENRQLKASLQERHRFSNIITSSPVMLEMLSVAARAAQSKAAVLIEGESGTGKELIAQAIHYAGKRGDRPLITVNCAAIPENLLESELFGHEKGAFTGAVAQKIGMVEKAHMGTLFLDEVGDIPLTVQVKLLRFLQFGEFQRVGGTEVKKVDVRLIAATNRNLRQLVAENKFREDFYYRLNVVNIHVPPLRKRKEDIPLLVDYFIKKFSTENDKPVRSLSKEAMDLLMKYDYPGNVRELENIIEQAVVLCREDVITKDDLPVTLSAGLTPAEVPPLEYYPGNFREKVEAFEKDLILDALKKHNFNQTRAARELGINERNLRYKIQKYHLR